MFMLPNISLITILTAFITAIFGPLMVEWIKMKFLHKKKDSLGEAISFDEKIDAQLETIMNEIKCDRICIAQFHNGGHFYPTGKSIKKFSICYERTSEKTSPIKSIFQNIPVSLYPKMFSLLYKGTDIIISNTKENTIDCGLFQVRGKNYKTKSFYVFPIKDINEHFIGTITVSYYDKKYDFTLENWILIRQKMGVIGTILTNYLHVKG